MPPVVITPAMQARADRIAAMPMPALMTGPAPDDISLAALCIRLTLGLIGCAAFAGLMIVSRGTIS